MKIIVGKGMGILSIGLVFLAMSYIFFFFFSECDVGDVKARGNERGA